MGSASGALARLGAALCAATVVAACAGGAVHPRGAATVPTVPPTTGDPWAVPSTIDAAYIDRVLAFLDHMQGEALRSVRQSNSLTSRYQTIEAAIRADAHEIRLQDALQRQNIAAGWPNISAVPGDRYSQVQRILQSGPTCIVAAVNEDFSRLTVAKPVPYPQWYVGLLHSDQSMVNPTHWAISYDGYESAGGVPDAPCEMKS